MKEIKFNEFRVFVGRKGRFQAKGIEIWGDGGESVVAIYPITSKGLPANCMIQIEKGEALNEVIETLIEANKAHQDIISVKEAIEILGIKRAWLYKLIEAGKITKYECLGKPGFSRVEIMNSKLYREVKS